MNHPIKGAAMEDARRSTGLLVVSLIGSLAFLIGWALLVGWLLWELGLVLVRHLQAM